MTEMPTTFLRFGGQAVWTAGTRAAVLLLGVALGAGIPLYGWKALAAVAGLVVAAVVFWRPYVGFLLLVASLPADVLGVIGDTDSSFVLSITKILALLTAVAAGFDLLFRQGIVSFRRFATPETIAGTLLVAIAAASAVLHPGEESRTETIRLITLLVFTFVTIYFVDSRVRLQHVLRVLVVVATLVAAQSIVQRRGGADMLSEEWVAQAGAVLDVGEEATGDFLRTSGTFSHPAWLGLFLTLTIPLTLYLIWTSARRSVVVGGVISIAVQILGVFSTYSRMAYLGVALGVGLFVLRRRGGPALLAVAVIAAVTCFPILPENVRARIYSIVEYQESSSSMTRIGQQIAGLMMLRDHPLWGVGPGNFESEVPRYATRIPDRYNVQPIGAHNMYVEMAAELGIPGLLAGLAMLGTAWAGARRLRKAQKAAGDTATTLLFESLGIALIVFAMSAVFVHSQERKEWWLIVALVAAARSFKPTPCSKEIPPP